MATGERNGLEYAKLEFVNVTRILFVNVNEDLNDTQKSLAGDQDDDGDVSLLALEDVRCRECDVRSSVGEYVTMRLAAYPGRLNNKLCDIIVRGLRERSRNAFL